MRTRIEFLSVVFAVAFVAVIGLPFAAHSYAPASSGANFGLADIASFSGALQWLKSAGYFLMFVAMFIEGPIVTSAAAFAAALGYFNIFIVFLLSVAADVLGDYMFYVIGYFGRVKYVEKYGHKVGLTKERMEKMEHLIKEHPTKTMAAIKLAPLIPGPGLMMIGATKMPLRKYTWITFIVTAPKAILFMVLGYYFGYAYEGISRYIENGEYFILVALVLIVLAYFGYQKLSARISARLEAV